MPTTSPEPLSVVFGSVPPVLEIPECEDPNSSGEYGRSYFVLVRKPYTQPEKPQEQSASAEEQFTYDFVPLGHPLDFKKDEVYVDPDDAYVKFDPITRMSGPFLTALAFDPRFRTRFSGAPVAEVLTANDQVFVGVSNYLQGCQSLLPSIPQNHLTQLIVSEDMIAFLTYATRVMSGEGYCVVPDIPIQSLEGISENRFQVQTPWGIEDFYHAQIALQWALALRSSGNDDELLAEIQKFSPANPADFQELVHLANALDVDEIKILQEDLKARFPEPSFWEGNGVILPLILTAALIGTLSNSTLGLVVAEIFGDWWRRRNPPAPVKSGGGAPTEPSPTPPKDEGGAGAQPPILLLTGPVAGSQDVAAGGVDLVDANGQPVPVGEVDSTNRSTNSVNIDFLSGESVNEFPWQVSAPQSVGIPSVPGVSILFPTASTLMGGYALSAAGTAAMLPDFAPITFRQSPVQANGIKSFGATQASQQGVWSSGGQVRLMIQPETVSALVIAGLLVQEMAFVYYQVDSQTQLRIYQAESGFFYASVFVFPEFAAPVFSAHALAQEIGTLTPTQMAKIEAFFSDALGMPITEDQKQLLFRVTPILTEAAILTPWILETGSLVRSGASFLRVASSSTPYALVPMIFVGISQQTHDLNVRISQCDQLYRSHDAFRAQATQEEMQVFTELENRLAEALKLNTFTPFGKMPVGLSDLQAAWNLVHDPKYERIVQMAGPVLANGVLDSFHRDQLADVSWEQSFGEFLAGRGFRQRQNNRKTFGDEFLKLQSYLQKPVSQTVALVDMP